MMHILVIDDEEYVRLVLEQAIREEGCEVTTASRGQEGLDRLASGTFDCVISDLRMPGTDGRAVLKWVKDHQPDVDVMILTGQASIRDVILFPTLKPIRSCRDRVRPGRSSWHRSPRWLLRTPRS